ncbi:MAG: hypothetical protein E7165_00165 [Firmicutes bacterium]|nr:hypothetical protein [Bacillota bacterium]
MERKNRVLTVIVTVLMLVIFGLVGFIIYDKVINKTNEPNIEDNNNGNSKIEVTSGLKSELRKLIPTVKYCNQYLYKQYNGSSFKSTDLTQEDKTSNFDECQGILGVYHTEYKYDSTDKEVYLYDYVLLYDQEGSDECSGCSYGKDYNNINIKESSIEIINNKVSDSSLKKYGQVYKYTFKLIDGNYEYVSTEAN